MGYNSKIDIKLPQIPELPESQAGLYPVMQQTFNAIHILNAVASNAYDYLESPSITKPADEAFSFVGRAFWGLIKPQSEADLADPDKIIESGKILYPAKGGWVLGADYFLALRKDSRDVKISLPFAIALDDPQALEDGAKKILLGFPPGIINAEGINVGDIIAVDTNGDIVAEDDTDGTLVNIGIGVDTDYVLLTWGLLATWK